MRKVQGSLLLVYGAKYDGQRGLINNNIPQLPLIRRLSTDKSIHHMDFSQVARIATALRFSDYSSADVTIETLKAFRRSQLPY